MQIKNSELAILVIVALMALAANLPEDAIGHVVDRNLVLMTLVTTVVISLFRYLKLVLFLAVSILAIGANLPDQLASQLGISQLAMIVASGVLVLIALIYKFYHLRVLERDSKHTQDTGRSKHDTINSRNEVMAAILNGDASALRRLLVSGSEINFSQNGNIPLFLAIENGHIDIVLLLLAYGAKLRVKNQEGKSPFEFAALQQDVRSRIAKIVQVATRNKQTGQGKALVSTQHKGRMVVLFADICGSTALYDKLGNEAALEVITSALTILSQVTAAHKGTVIKTIGDEVMCSFSSITVAAQAACAMHFAIDVRRPGGDYPIYVRIGFHYGEVIHKENDVFGDTVNIAARVTGITRARQIMTTKSVIDALPTQFADKVRPVMRAAFRGKKDSFAVFQIIWEPEDTLLGRIGLSSFRKHMKSDSVTFSDVDSGLHQV